MKTAQNQIAKFFVLVFLFAAGSVSAQDLLYKKNQAILKVHINEIGLDEIKYTLFDDPTGPVMVVDKSEVIKVIFEKGNEWVNTPDPYDVSAAVEVRDKTRAYRFNFLSPAFGSLAFSYEQVLKPGMNLNATLGIIGVSTNSNLNEENPSGFFVKLGAKYKTGSEYRMRGMTYTHHLAGRYIMPELCVSTFHKDAVTYDYNYGYYPYYTASPLTTRKAVTSIAFNLVYGKQFILGNAVVIDWNAGFGMGVQFTSDNNSNHKYDNSESWCYSHFYGGSGFPVTYSMSIGIGFLGK
jgi:hypothetical protein